MSEKIIIWRGTVGKAKRLSEVMTQHTERESPSNTYHRVCLFGLHNDDPAHVDEFVMPDLMIGWKKPSGYHANHLDAAAILGHCFPIEYSPFASQTIPSES